MAKKNSKEEKLNYSARFIGRYGCDRYYMHNKQLQFDQRQQEIIKRMDEIQWTV